MRKLMPLRKAVVQITHEATADDQKAILKAVKSWHNRLSNGSVPREVVTKLGRQLFIDLEAWDDWLLKRKENPNYKGIGRPRSI